MTTRQSVSSTISKAQQLFKKLIMPKLSSVEDLSRKTRNLERQVRELLERLDETEEKVSALIAGQISLKASVADATREDGTPSSYDKRF